jgi:CBS domain-containing protein
MTKEPVNARESISLSEIIKIMVKNTVGSVIIVDSNDIPVGIITERELLRDIAAHARVSDDASAKEIMSLAFIRVPPATTIEEAAVAMIEGSVRLVVTKKSRLVGVVSTSDLLRYFNKTARDIPIESAIQKRVQTMDGSRSVLDAITLMYESRIGSVVLTRSGLPFGILTERDLLRVLARGRKKEFGSLRLDELASGRLISAPYGISAREASSIMLERRIKRLPLFKGDKLAGIVTAKDLVGAYSASIKERRSHQELFNIT